MNNDLFFPLISRKKVEFYHNRDGKFYSDYKSNYDKVSEDCLKRCVYCDATEKECGGDRFSLDHFRPRKVFADKFDGILIIHPYNLYLSCQKCNVLKSSDWHGCSNDMNGYTFTGKKGYLDRFSHNYLSYLSVSEKGELSSIVDDSPVDYMIKKLHLNRPNRVYLRQRRILKCKAENILEQIKKISSDIISQYDKGEIRAENAMTKIKKIQELQDLIQSFYKNTA
ncbi:hypothetical protein [Serratia marcescens]|uniref:hypothetical protein n=1 Tax=Serratia marcescens TaxID=615 RepID=UPI001F1563D2|nr:hypothetical protein [Serratia marcescens]